MHSSDRNPAMKTTAAIVGPGKIQLAAAERETAA
jgi:hypothetical protein